MFLSNASDREDNAQPQCVRGPKFNPASASIGRVLGLRLSLRGSIRTSGKLDITEILMRYEVFE